MNKRYGVFQRTAAWAAALLLTGCMTAPVFAEQEEPLAADPPAVTEETAVPAENPEQTDVTENTEDTGTTDTTDTTAETTDTTETTTEGTTAEITTMAPPETLDMLEYETLPQGGVRILYFRWTVEETVEIPAEINGQPVTEIGEAAFKYCYADSVVLPATVQRIGDRAFEGCAYLQAMTIPADCTAIGASAFAGCKKLETVFIPEKVTEIGAKAFDNTPFLNNQAGDTVILGSGILYACRSSASELTIPDTVRTIAADACAGLEQLRSVTIPDSVTCIQSGAFAHCTALAEIHTPDTIESLAADAFADTKWEGAGKDDFLTLGNMLYRYRGSENEVAVPDGIRIINDEAFAGNNAVTVIRLPESVHKIRNGAFRECASLQVAEFGDQLSEIGEDAFRSCKTLNYLRLGHALETVGAHAFADCPNLTEIYLPDTLKNVGAQAFGYGTADSGSFVLLKNELTLYANAQAVRNYAEAAGINHAPLPDEENTEPAPIVTTAENEKAGFGKISGTAWIPACAFGGMLIAGGAIGCAVRRRREAE